MKGISLFIVVAVWVSLCGWFVEKIGNLMPDRSMRMLAKFLLFVIFAIMPVLELVAKATESGAPKHVSEQKARRPTIVVSNQAVYRKGSQ
jgi:hypothetical protein